MIIGTFLFGLIIGSFLNVVIYRVPAGKSLLPESHCPKCDATVRPWQNVPVLSWVALRGRCANCLEPISIRYPLVELGTGITFAIVTWQALSRAAQAEPSALTPPASSTAWLLLSAFIFLAAISIVLALIDIDTFRLPNAIVYPAIATFGALLVAAALTSGDFGALTRALVGGISLAGFYGLLWFFWPGGMGLGDVKLAILLGLALGWVGWGALIVGAFAAFVCGGVFGGLLMLFGKAGRKTRIPFGPWMLLGAWIGIFVGEPIANWYLVTFIGA